MKENSVKHNMSLSVRGEDHNGSGREAREAGPAHGVDSDRGTEATLGYTTGYSLALQSWCDGRSPVGPASVTHTGHRSEAAGDTQSAQPTAPYRSRVPPSQSMSGLIIKLTHFPQSNFTRKVIHPRTCT